jgi:hypothetical protein
VPARQVEPFFPWLLLAAGSACIRMPEVERIAV